MPHGRGRKKETISREVGSDAPGWDAIDAALGHLVGDQEPVHWGQTEHWPNDSIWGISACLMEGRWLYVTYGLSELFDKTSDDAAVSGWGIELTTRVVARAESPPAWPTVLLSKLGQYVYDTGNVFASGHRFDAQGPITGGDPPTKLVAVAFAPDPQLGSIETPNGSVAFLTAFGITRDELDRMQATTTFGVLAQLSPEGLLVTDPGRA